MILIYRGRRGGDRVVVGFTAIRAYHHCCCEFESRWGRGVQDYVIVYQWLATGRWFSSGTSVSSTNKTDLHDITEILLKVALNTNKQTNKYIVVFFCLFSDLRWEVNVPFCWYWWMCSQFKLYFIKQYIYSELIDTKLYISLYKMIHRYNYP